MLTANSTLISMYTVLIPFGQMLHSMQYSTVLPPSDDDVVPLCAQHELKLRSNSCTHCITMLVRKRPLLLLLYIPLYIFVTTSLMKSAQLKCSMNMLRQVLAVYTELCLIVCIYVLFSYVFMCS